jgi:hypothetical protein
VLITRGPFFLFSTTANAESASYRKRRRPTLNSRTMNHQPAQTPPRAAITKSKLPRRVSYAALPSSTILRLMQTNIWCHTSQIHRSCTCRSTHPRLNKAWKAAKARARIHSRAFVWFIFRNAIRASAIPISEASYFHHPTGNKMGCSPHRRSHARLARYAHPFAHCCRLRASAVLPRRHNLGAVVL